MVRGCKNLLQQNPMWPKTNLVFILKMCRMRAHLGCAAIMWHPLERERGREDLQRSSMPALSLYSAAPPACSSSLSFRSSSSSWEPTPATPRKNLLLARLPIALQWKNHYNQRFAVTHSPANNANVWLQSASKVHALQASGNNVKWVFEPLVVRSGNTRQLREVEHPSAFELVSDSATVGGAAGKADIVIPLSTVSAYHTQLEKRGELLYVTDLDSADGTYVDRKKLKPNDCKPILPGSYITFGDKHLAVFRFLKIEKLDDVQESEM